MAQGVLSVKDGNGAPQTVAVMSDLAGNLMPMQSQDSSQQVYTAAVSFTPTATGAVTVASFTGSATKTCRIQRVTVSGSATALSSTLFGIQRTSALGAGGTAVPATAAKLDPLSAAATGVLNGYSTTLKAAGTPVGGAIRQVQLFQTTVTTPTVAFCEAQCLHPDKGVAIGQSIVLRSATDFLEIQNLNGGNLAAGSILQVNVTWVEDNS